MPINKYALLRYRVIDRCLTNKGKLWPTREDLRDACEEALFGSGGHGISLSTIDKDIWAMKNEGELGYYAPIEFNRLHRGYCYSDPNYSISNLSLGDDDLEAIRFAAATLQQFRTIPIFKQYESAIEKIINRIQIAPNPNDAGIEQFVQFEKSTVSKGSEFLGPLLEAIKEHHSIRINYRKFTDEKTKSYELLPYLLKEYQSRWYLIARDAQDQRIRTFGLERIDHLSKGERSFEADPLFNPDHFFKYSIGITELNDLPMRVVIKFKQPAGKFLDTQPLHPSQELIEADQTSATFSWYVLLTEELYRFILGYGAEAEVLDPPQLAETIAKRQLAAADLYKKRFSIS
jgi:predicted DNA-binding transcriptional regulator YafY